LRHFSPARSYSLGDASARVDMTCRDLLQRRESNSTSRACASAASGADGSSRHCRSRLVFHVGHHPRRRHRGSDARGTSSSRRRGATSSRPRTAARRSGSPSPRFRLASSHRL